MTRPRYVPPPPPDSEALRAATALYKSHNDALAAGRPCKCTACTKVRK